MTSRGQAHVLGAGRITPLLKVLLGILVIIVFLASAVSFVGGAVLKYAVTEGSAYGIDIQATGTLLLLAGILGFLLFLALLAVLLIMRRRERQAPR
jgi:Zn-dependent protease with chaperone function